MESSISSISGLVKKSSNSSSSASSLLFNKLGNADIALCAAAGIYDGMEVSGHVWLADGTWETGMIIRYWNFEPDPSDSNLTIPVCTEISDRKEYIHFNWGFGGNCNGYFLVNILNPNNAFEYDDQNEDNTTYDFTYSKYFYYSIYSIDKTRSKCANLN